MYCGSGTVDRIANGQPRLTLLHMVHAADVTRALTKWQHFSAGNDVMDVILKVWHRSVNP